MQEKVDGQLKYLWGNFRFTLYCWDFFFQWTSDSDCEKREDEDPLGWACQRGLWGLMEPQLHLERHHDAERGLQEMIPGQDYRCEQRWADGRCRAGQADPCEESRGSPSRSRPQGVGSWIFFFFKLHTDSCAYEYILKYLHMNFLLWGTRQTLSPFVPAFPSR